jgi:hypothetical protein
MEFSAGCFLYQAAAVKEKKKHAYLGLKKGAWILCIVGGKGLLSCWVAEFTGLAGLRFVSFQQ